MRLVATVGAVKQLPALILAGHLTFLSGLLVAKAGRGMLRPYKRTLLGPLLVFVSVASKELRVYVSGLESTWRVSVDSKVDGCLGGCGSGRPSGARERPCLARVD